jgi:hypothetical protein
MLLRPFPILGLRAALALLAVGFAFLLPAQSRATSFGGTYDELSPKQQALVAKWMQGYREIYGRSLDPETTYNQLPLSARTTFQAVTHALQNSQLTSKNGKPMGTALDLVDLVERVAGQVPGNRGDEQFRIYVYLKPNSINVLYSAKEFERVRDNTVYHIGYPINFRQQGGVPSIQISLARTGKRADIDVDYRSSAGVQALVSGHLTSANSDVRAGSNQEVHNRRWSGLPNWWKDLLAAFAEKPVQPEVEDGLIPGAAGESKRIAHEAIHEAIHAYLSDWLMQDKPEQLLPLYSIKSFPCVAEFGGDSRPDSKLALLRILRRLRERRAALGKVSRLEDVIRAVSYRLPDSTTIQHPYEGIFSLQEVPEDVAWAIDCRIRYRLHLVESIPRPPHRYNKTYVSSMRVNNPTEPNTFLVLTWKQESGGWKIVSFDIKRKTLSPPADLFASLPQPPSANAESDQVSSDASKFLGLWLLDKKPQDVGKYFLPEALACKALEPDRPVNPIAFLQNDASALQRFLEEGIKAALPDKQLEGVIASVEAYHPDLKPLAHSHSSSFLLAEVGGDLLRMSPCSSGEKPSRSPQPGVAPAKGFATLFRFVSTDSENPTTLTFYWKKSAEGWRIYSYTVAAD